MQLWYILKIIFVSFLINTTLQASDRGKEKAEEEEEKATYRQSGFRNSSSDLKPLAFYQALLIPCLNDPYTFNHILKTEVPAHYHEAVFEALKARGYLQKEGSTSNTTDSWVNTAREKLELSFRETLQSNALEEEGLKRQEQALFEESFLRQLAQFLEASQSSPQSLPDLLKSKRAAEQFSVMPIFVMGSPRSGTTLIGNYIGSCSKVCNLIEYPGSYLALRVGPSFQSKVETDYKLELYDAMFDFVTLFSAELVRKKGREAYVDSNPFNFRVIKKLQEKLRSALFIVMLRDYRGVISSLKKSYEVGYSWAGKDDSDRAKLYYKFYKRLKNIDLERVIFLNYDQLCANPNETLDAFDQQFYDKLKALFNVENPKTEWVLDRRVLGQSHAATYSKAAGNHLPRTFNIKKEEKDRVTLSPIASFNPQEWPPQRESEVCEWIIKVALDVQEKKPHIIDNLRSTNKHFDDFYASLEGLRQKYESKNKVLTGTHQDCIPRIWNVPSLNKNFIGRKKFLKDLYTGLQEQSMCTICSSVTGMAGIGKTQIAKHYANLYKGNYRLVWWFNGARALDKQYEDLARAINDRLEFWNQGLEPSLHLKEITSNFTVKVKDWLRITPHPWLLIFDDIPSESSIREYLPENHGSSLGHIIATSKNSIAWSLPLKLEVFKRFESIKLLKQLTCLAADDKADALAELLGDFPLAIAQAGAYIRARPSSSFQDYITLYTTKRKALGQEEERLRQQDNPLAYDKYKSTITITFNLALEEIQKHSLEAFDLLTLCAFIHKRTILEDMLKDWLIYKGVNSDFTFGKAINQLMQHSLIEKENDHAAQGPGTSYALHELVQRATRDKILFDCSGLLESFYRFLISMADSPVKFGGGVVKSVEQEKVQGICDFIFSKARTLLTMDFSTLEAYQKALSYLSHIVSLIGHAKSLPIAHESFSKIDWLGKILFLIGLDLQVSLPSALTLQGEIREDYKEDNTKILEQARKLFLDAQAQQGDIQVLNCLLDIGKKGPSQVQNSIGYLFYQGWWLSKEDYQKAKRWFQKAANQGHMSAQYNLGVMYQHGWGVKQDYEEAKQWYLKAAAQGHMSAQYNLGYIYYNVQGIEVDYEEAKRWFQKAANQGHMNAQYSLGIMYQHGLGEGQDYEEAKKWYLKAAAQGNAVAIFNLGWFYTYGLGCSKNYEEAQNLYKKAFDLFKEGAERNEAYAHYMLGEMYYYGRGVEKNYEEAKQWYLAAANQGNGSAQAELGNFYKEGIGGEQDIAQALKWFKCAVEKNNDKGRYYLALMYRDGEGLDNNDIEAISLLQEAAKEKDGDAIYMLGWMYENGRGVEANIEKAKAYYREGERLIPFSAYYSLGRMYELGLSVSVDINQAKAWYNKAATLEFIYAIEKLRALSSSN